ncbi:MAG: hypothetical protein H6618_04785 [Deltaproteobacteria bacterium]|nr:hypothetical protein [Deltaproteobacteria bacterium]
MRQHKQFQTKNQSFLILICLTSLLTSCYFVDFFSKNEDNNSPPDQESLSSLQDTVLGQSLGNKAGSVDTLALETVHSTTSTIPPASIRADPDLYARRLLLQYRPEGSTVAREIGAIEAYRLLLGGASQDFQKTPQTSFDATSLLAMFSVSRRICTALVAPDPALHQDWQSILPSPPEDRDSNLRFLAQRISGRPSSDVTEHQLTSLKDIMDAWSDGSADNSESYIPACITLMMDAESLFL